MAVTRFTCPWGCEEPCALCAREHVPDADTPDLASWLLLAFGMVVAVWFVAIGVVGFLLTRGAVTP